MRPLISLSVATGVRTVEVGVFSQSLNLDRVVKVGKETRRTKPKFAKFLGRHAKPTLRGFQAGQHFLHFFRAVQINVRDEPQGDTPLVVVGQNFVQTTMCVRLKLG